ncbi:Uncharacterised protein [Kingella potus]|uniref:Uncharacterized protein n=1 Tax=Kingella potus TaxID=265175 RepID=A0A377R3L8_9NEIS|nr:Uncharacterised protein [Kingella potus]
MPSEKVSDGILLLRQTEIPCLPQDIPPRRHTHSPATHSVFPANPEAAYAAKRHILHNDRHERGRLKTRFQFSDGLPLYPDCQPAADCTACTHQSITLCGRMPHAKSSRALADSSTLAGILAAGARSPCGSSK